MAEEQKIPYRVLARKYRPQNFDQLIGQDALVRTLKNAIQSGRIAHAFMLTGVRGVGKTTTARIIAKALNYTGPDGQAGPTVGPTDDCEICRAISADRHPDVLEMDAASRTGVDDIREILDGVRYAPTSARYKIYIIDEVHMLSKNAFNALLKTLEEPPPHVKFIFATTEIRKVPVTVLSRCQRFDLRRVDAPTLAEHYAKICGLENVVAEDEAIAMIARAADGSVRDGLSLLDQAIALGGEGVSAQLVKDMLGLVDRARTLDLLEKALTGGIAEALALMEELYRGGADPSAVIGDLLDYTHILTRLRAVPGTKDLAGTMAADTLEAAAALAGKLSMPSIGRAWQILLKGLAEVNAAPNPQAAAEMVVIRLSYAADLPDPAELLKKLKSQPEGAGAGTPAAYAPSRDPAPVARAASGGGDYESYGAAAPMPSGQPAQAEQIRSLQDIVALLEAHREPILAGQVFHMAHLVRLAKGRLEIRPASEAPADLTQKLGMVLTKITGTRWIVSVSSSANAAPTLAQAGEAEKAALMEKIKAAPAVARILDLFPGAEVVRILDETD